MSPVDVACGSDVQRIFIILYVGVVVESQGVDNVLLARRHAREHGVVYGMVIAGIGIGLPRPVTVFVDGAADVELRIQTVGSLHIHGLIGIDTVLRVIACRLRCLPVVEVGRRANMPLLLVAPCPVRIVYANAGCDEALEVGIAQFDDERLAVVAIGDAVG